MHCKTKNHINQTQSIKLPDDIESKDILKMIESGQARIKKCHDVITHEDYWKLILIE